MTRKINYQGVTLTNQTAVNELIIAAFNEDTLKHGQGPAGGPPGYDNGQLLAKLQVEEGLLESVYYQEQLVGCYCVQPLLGKEKAELRLLCVAVTHQNQGFGQQIWQELEERLPYKRWLVETPAYSIDNQRFYEESCGFHTVAIHDYQGSQGIVFEKQIEGKD